jgi:hypothetical protein
MMWTITQDTPGLEEQNLEGEKMEDDSERRDLEESFAVDAIAHGCLFVSIVLQQLLKLRRRIGSFWVG